LVTQ